MKTIRLFLIIILLLLYSGITIWAGKIVILTNKEYNDIIQCKENFKKKVMDARPNLELIDVNFEQEDRPTTIQLVNNIGPDVIVSIGISATQFSFKNFEQYYKIFTLIPSLNKLEINSKLLNHYSGIETHVSDSLKLEVLGQLFDKSYTISTIYAEDNFTEVDKIRQIADRNNFRFDPYSIFSSRQVPKVLRKIEPGTIFWLIFNQHFYETETLITLLKTLNKKNVYILTPHVNFLKQNDIYGHISISFDPSEIGIQTANLTIKQLKEKDQAIESPEKIYCYLKKGLDVKNREIEIQIKWVQ